MDDCQFRGGGEGPHCGLWIWSGGSIVWERRGQKYNWDFSNNEWVWLWGRWGVMLTWPLIMSFLLIFNHFSLNKYLVLF